MNDNIDDQDKLLRFLSLNLAYLLKQSREVIKYETPQYGDPDLGFALTMSRIDNKAYDYATECFRLIGKDPVRECGVTQRISFDSPEESDSFRDHFKSLLDQAEKKLCKIGGTTPHEYYFLNCAPVIIGTEDAPSNHYVLLQATVQDDLDRKVCREILGDCEIADDAGTVEIKVSCYREKWRDRLLRYLKGIGIDVNSQKVFA